MDRKDLKVIENDTKSKVQADNHAEIKHISNPIEKKLAKFHFEKTENFSVIDLFKK